MAGKVTVVRSLQFHFMLKTLVSVWTGQKCNVITALGKGADSLHKQTFMPPIRSQASVCIGSSCRGWAGTPWWCGVLPACETRPQHAAGVHLKSSFLKLCISFWIKHAVRAVCCQKEMSVEGDLPPRLPMPAGWPWLHVILTFGDILFRWERFGSCLHSNTKA